LATGQWVSLTLSVKRLTDGFQFTNTVGPGPQVAGNFRPDGGTGFSGAIMVQVGSIVGGPSGTGTLRIDDVLIQVR
jgi:hypothetical protein